jgi:hypothetical protein
MTDNDINLLMQRVDEINAKAPFEYTDTDISIIIAYHRQQRARRAAGEKPVRPKIDLESILGKIAPAKSKTPIVTRRL